MLSKSSILRKNLLNKIYFVRAVKYVFYKLISVVLLKLRSLEDTILKFYFSEKSLKFFIDY